jgi:16S rRNA (guanine527-N7)-methyltransferase
MSVAKRLAALSTEYGLPPDAIPRLERLLDALAAEPDPHTTVSDPASAVDQHVADSLSALKLDPVRAAGTIVDIGSGAGFPGLPLAIALPDARVDLVDAARRKTAVIERLAVAARIENARALPMRVEELGVRNFYEVATARAVASLAVLVEYAAPPLRLGGHFVAWKGTRDAAEEAAGSAAAEIVGLRAIDVLQVSPFAGTRDLNLHLYLKERETSDRFPRRTGVAAKRPLA